MFQIIGEKRKVVFVNFQKKIEYWIQKSGTYVTDVEFQKNFKDNPLTCILQNSIAATYV